MDSDRMSGVVSDALDGTEEIEGRASESNLALVPPTAIMGATCCTASAGNRPRRIQWIKERTCRGVWYPDGTEGICRYERLGPAYHRFTFLYEDGACLVRLYRMTRLQAESKPESKPESIGIQTMTAQAMTAETLIDSAAQTLAGDAFAAAIEQERRDYFARATPPTSGMRQPDPSRYQIPAARAKRLGGKYALCQPIGMHLIPVSLVFERLEMIAPLWRGRSHADQVIGCCNRLDRCWEIPRYNPLVSEGHPRRKTMESEAASYVS